MAKKTKKKVIAKLDYNLAAVLSDRVSIMNVILVDSQCSQTPTAIRCEQQLEIDAKIKHEINKKQKEILIFANFALKGFPRERNSEEADLIIKATFVLIYKVESFAGLKEENFEAFSNTNGIFNAWPYWREFVQNTVTRMGLPPLTIPVFRLSPPKKVKKTKKKKA